MPSEAEVKYGYCPRCGARGVVREALGQEMSIEHTPGPWTYSVGLSVDPINSDEMNDAYFAINGKGHREFASVVRLRASGEVHPNGEATARLIAAAPDLLAVCKAEERLREDSGPDPFISLDLALWLKKSYPAEFEALFIAIRREDVVDRLQRVRRAAIRKAGGER